ncbi:Protein argonaute-3 [Pseudolycoriella hygida]|uniref:Protein argonaute-3 n=1 Tax=Pseudolycoriella hygida TaxID=35572 RepID=A0A9Q0NEA6_9DIPT|nr:Protein argonaute-3 [Pseudolycoriella hygida]
MAGRGSIGRGLILKLLEETRAGGDENSSASDTQNLQTTSSESGLGSIRSAGRGRFLLDSLMDQSVQGHSSKELSTAPSDESASDSFLIKPTSGRGRVLELLIEKTCAEKSILAQSTDGTDGADSAAVQLEEIKIESVELVQPEMEPVIRRGTKAFQIRDPRRKSTQCVAIRRNGLEALLGAVVLTRYNNKTYRIDDILYTENPMSTFQMNGKDVSYLEYYKSHYDIDLTDEMQPLLLSREERRISGKEEKETITFCLIPEICYLTGITDTIREDQKVMRDIATITRVTPNQRVDAMNTFCKNLDRCKEAKDVLAGWGLEMDMNALKLVGRQLEDEEIIFGRGKTIKAERADFNKHCCSNQLYKAIDITNWIVIYNKRDTKVAQQFIDIMQRNSAPMGLKVSPPKTEILTDDKNDQYVQLLRKVINAALQIIVIICPSSRDDRYAAIKKVCCGELPIPTQVINAKTLANEAKVRGIVAKIALQMNCKIGGSLWTVKIPFKNVMICGIDTYHDSKKKDNSVGGFVASLNASYTEWYSRAIIQSQKEELVNGLSQSLVASLDEYKRRNNVLPEKIIIFRDGVGDGQLKMVKEYELQQLIQASALKHPGYKPQFTIIIVQKRINTRLFATRANGVDNPAPGCIIDHTITRRFLYDFFLVPQNVRQGTVSPTHYIVLHDDNNFSPDVLQRLSFKMCFMYYNWPGTVRVPACCQYAHKLAFLVGQSVKKQPADILSTKLYYL